MKNPVAKNLHKTCKPLVVPQKQSKLTSDASLRDVQELLSESQFDSETMCFDGIYLEPCSGLLNDIGSSNISVNTFEDEGEEL